MTRQGLLEFDGRVTHATPGGLFCVTLDNHLELLAKVCDDMRCHWICVTLGDHVRVSVSPYDLRRGLIVCRYR